MLLLGAELSTWGLKTIEGKVQARIAQCDSSGSKNAGKRDADNELRVTSVRCICSESGAGEEERVVRSARRRFCASANCAGKI